MYFRKSAMKYIMQCTEKAIDHYDHYEWPELLTREEATEGRRRMRTYIMQDLQDIYDLQKVSAKEAERIAERFRAIGRWLPKMPLECRENLQHAENMFWREVILQKGIAKEAQKRYHERKEVKRSEAQNIEREERQDDF